MAVSKVILNGNTLIDTTDKTVTDSSMLSGVTALKNDGTTATGNIATKTSANLSVSGDTVTAPAGYYASAASASVASGTTGTPTATKGTVSNHAVTVTPSVTNTTGYITGGTKTGTAVTVSASELVSGTKSITSSGTTDVTNYATATVPSAVANGSVAGNFVNVSNVLKYRISGGAYAESGGWVDGDSTVGTEAVKDLSVIPSNTIITPTTSVQTIGDRAVVLEGPVTVAAMPTGTEGTPTATKGSVSNHSVSVTPSVTNTTGYITGGTKTGTAVTVSASELVSGTYTVDSSGTKDVTNYASASVPAGTAGTPSATKGTVSNHSISVIPSVTNTTGYITGSTISGTAVTVTAAELESGTKSITSNGTNIDVTGYAAVDVAVSGGGGLEYEAGTWTPTEDVATGTIAFSNQHTSPPIFVMIADTSEITNDSSNAVDVIGNYYEFLGHTVKSGPNNRYAIRAYGYVPTAGGAIGWSYTASASTSTTNSWASATYYYPYTGSTSRYWRAGRTYKWIAVWPPTT